MKKVYAIYDKAVAAYAAPFLARTDAEACRMFVASTVENLHFLSNAHDYALCYLCEYNEQTGEFGVPEEQRLTVPKIVMTGPVAAAHAREMVEPLEVEKPALEVAQAV